MLLNWYSYSASGLFNWLGRVFERSFHLLEKFNAIPNILFISFVIIMLVVWMFRMRRYDAEAKDKGLID